MSNQKTLRTEAYIEGIGLHTGKKVRLKFIPAPEDTGIQFIRTDLSTKPKISVSVDNLVFNVSRQNCLEKEGVFIQTIEHLLAVLSGLEIDNLYIEIDGEEIPGLDGSGKEFLELFESVGLIEQSKPRRFISVKEPIFIEDAGNFIFALPSEELRIAYTLNYDHPFLKAQFQEFVITPEVFKREIATARTFCLEEEADLLLKEGYGKGASYENTLVVTKEGVINNTLRFPDEFVRHKILDLLGDLYILGPVKAKIIALRSGHRLNTKLIQRIYSLQKKLSKPTLTDNLNLNKTRLTQEEIKKILPHREPFLFVDEIIHLERGKCAVGVKRLSLEDYFFKGHFPGRPVMPGVLIVEAMAQVGGVMMLSCPEHFGKLAFFMSIDNVKFRKTVLPGDELVMKVNAVRIKTKTGQVRAEAYVNNQLVCEADLYFAIVEG